jgi:hypothetical protein
VNANFIYIPTKFTENAPIKKHSLPPPRLSKQMRQSGIGNSAGACSSAFSTGTTMTALDTSGNVVDY